LGEGKETAWVEQFKKTKVDCRRHANEAPALSLKWSAGKESWAYYSNHRRKSGRKTGAAVIA